MRSWCSRPAAISCGWEPSEISAQGRDATGVRVARLGGRRDGQCRGAGARNRSRDRRGHLNRRWRTWPTTSGRRRPATPEARAESRARRPSSRTDAKAARPGRRRERGRRQPRQPEPTAPRLRPGRTDRACAVPASAPVDAERRYRQTIHRVDLWSVLKISVCFYICGMVVTMRGVGRALGDRRRRRRDPQRRELLR